MTAQSDAVLGIGRLVGSVSLLVLLWEVASQVKPETSYVVAVGLLVAFLAGAAAIGVAVSLGVDRTGRPGLLLPVGMRDFAVAAGIAASAFGPGSTRVLGIYGLLVLLAGTATATATATRLG